VKHRTRKGFTLIELMVVLAILAITLAIALPAFSELTLSIKLKSYANDVVAGVYMARGEAIKRNTPVELCTSDNGTSCAGSGDWEQGWIVLAPNDPNDVVIHHHQRLSSGFKIISNVPTITFQPSGASSTAAEMIVCRASPEVGGQERRVRISATGKPKVTTPEPPIGSCP